MSVGLALARLLGPQIRSSDRKSAPWSAGSSAGIPFAGRPAAPTLARRERTALFGSKNAEYDAIELLAAARESTISVLQSIAFLTNCRPLPRQCQLPSPAG